MGLHRVGHTYWCKRPDIAGHRPRYIVYGPLANGATTRMYEAPLNHPREDRFWDIIEKYRVNTSIPRRRASRAF